MICKTIMFDHKARSQYCTSSDHENFLQFTLYSQTYQSSLVFDFCVENSPEYMKKPGLVGAIGQLRHFLVIKPVTGGGRGHKRENIYRKKRAQLNRPAQCGGRVRILVVESGFWCRIFLGFPSKSAKQRK